MKRQFRAAMLETTVSLGRKRGSEELSFRQECSATILSHESHSVSFVTRFVWDVESAVVQNLVFAFSFKISLAGMIQSYDRIIFLARRQV